MERGNFSAAAGFGFDKDRFGVFSTFGAFLEMVISEVTMARLNFCNVLCHFSHSGGTCVFEHQYHNANGTIHTQSTRCVVTINVLETAFAHRGNRWRITLATSA